MTPEKKEKWTKKLDKMIDFLEEFKECLEESEYTDGVEYRGSRLYKHDDDELSGRYGYRRGRM